MVKALAPPPVLPKDLARALAPTSEIIKTLDTMRPLYEQLSDIGRMLSKIQMPSLPRIAVPAASSLVTATQLGLVAEALRPTLDWARITAEAAKVAVDGQLLTESFAKLTERYGELVGTAHGGAERVNVHFETATFDYYNEVDLLGLVGGSAERETDALAADLRSEIFRSTSSAIDELLGRYLAPLVPVLKGARESASSRNPERVRHTCVSYRELLTQLLHRLAPDNAVAGWTTEKAHFNQGRPTRRARLLYICRNAQGTSLVGFALADLDSFLAGIDLLQTGTHGIAVAWTDGQFAALQNRAEGLIWLLLEVAFGSGS